MSPIAKHTVTTNPQKPTCPKHQQTMRFDKVNSEWVCQEFDCTLVARLKIDPPTPAPLPTPPPPGQTPEVVKVPDLTLGIQKDADGIERYTIIAESRALGEIAIDVSDHIEMVVDEHSDSISLVLLFNDVRRT